MPLRQSGARAVLFGVHSYQHLSDLPGVSHNVPALRDLLLSDAVGGFAGEHCAAIRANSSPSTVLDAVQDAADCATDLLLIYYAGHGHFGRDGKSLLLGTEASRRDRPHHSIPYDEIRAIVARSRARHRVVIVDCCFSGVALHMDGQQSSDHGPDFDITGACVLTSSSETEQSLCLPDGSLFTRELVLLLRDGLSGELSDGRRGEHCSLLTMADIYEGLCRRLKSRSIEGRRVPEPRMSTRDSGHRIPLTANRAHTSLTASARDGADKDPVPVPVPPNMVHTAYAATRYFTGRDAQLEALDLMSSQTAAVCVVHGRGGQGKTELLRAAAGRIARHFTGGCLEIDLRGWTPGEQPRDPHIVVAEQLHHLGYSPESISTDLTARTETWRMFLTQHAVLLLLDNARNSEQLAPLLPPAGSPSMALISSRSMLPDLNAHWRYELPPLPVEDCVTVWHKMGIPAKTVGLGEIADRIYGSPLALGPVGMPLSRGASPGAVLALLSSPDRSTAFPTVEAAERAAFTMAYNALPLDVRTLIHHCAWHPGPNFGPDSLAAMSQRPEYEVEVRLTEIEQLLIRKNGRYSFHDLSLTYARQTALHNASGDEERSSRNRLYGHLHSELRKARIALRTNAAASDVGSRRAREWLDTHAQELQAAAHAAHEDNWVPTSAFLDTLAVSLRLDDRYIESRELFQSLLDNTSPGSVHHANALYGMGEVDRMQGMYEEATASYEKALTIYLGIGNELGQGHATYSLGHAHRAQGRYEQAADTYTKALVIYKAIGNKLGQANVTRGLGYVHREQGRYEEAASAYADALLICEQLGDRFGQANATRGLGHTHRARGQLGEAAAAFDDALRIYRELGNRRGEAHATRGLGQVYQALASYGEAVTAYTDALTIYRDIGSRLGQAHARHGLGEIHQAQGRHDEAVTAYTDALTIYRDIGSRLGQAHAIHGLSEIHRTAGRYEEAIGGFTSARDLYAEMGIADCAASCQRVLGELSGAH